MPSTKEVLKFLKLNENAISMAFGALVVLIVGVILFNSFKNQNTGTPQISQQAAQTQTPQEGQVPQNVGGTYKVAKGDTLWSIAEKNYGSGYNWVDIATENKLLNPGAIEEGQELTLPKVAAKSQTALNTEDKILNTKPNTPTPTAMAGVQQPTGTAPQAIGSESYTVAPGDHLWGIAVRAYGDGYQWVKIWQANKAAIGNHPNLIYVGQSLTIPRDVSK